MMKYRIEIGAQAQSDITDIMRYIGQVLLEPRTAGNLYRPQLKADARALSV